MRHFRRLRVTGCILTAGCKLKLASGVTSAIREQASRRASMQQKQTTTVLPAACGKTCHAYQVLLAVAPCSGEKAAALNRRREPAGGSRMPSPPCPLPPESPPCPLPPESPPQKSAHTHTPTHANAFYKPACSPLTHPFVLPRAHTNTHRQSLGRAEVVLGPSHCGRQPTLCKPYRAAESPRLTQAPIFHHPTQNRNRKSSQGSAR